MNWINIEREEQLKEIQEQQKTSIIFKHSTRCSISMMAKKRVDLDADLLPVDISCYFLDLIKYRTISNEIASMFNVHHESPQLLVVKNGECILDQSHGGISIEEVVEVVASP